VSKTINQLLHFFAAGDYFAKFGEKKSSNQFYFDLLLQPDIVFSVLFSISQFVIKIVNVDVF